MLCGGGGACGKLVIVDLLSLWIILGFGGRKVRVCGGGKLGGGGDGTANTPVSGMVVVGYLNGGKIIICVGKVVGQGRVVA